MCVSPLNRNMFERGTQGVSVNSLSGLPLRV